MVTLRPSWEAAMRIPYVPTLQRIESPTSPSLADPVARWHARREHGVAFANARYGLTLSPSAQIYAAARKFPLLKRANLTKGKAHFLMQLTGHFVGTSIDKPLKRGECWRARTCSDRPAYDDFKRTRAGRGLVHSLGGGAL
jgi:hypothetical protein